MGSTVTFSDGLGDRVRAIDADGRALEVLRVGREYLDAPGFERAVHERAARLSALHDPAIAHVRRIERDATLAIVSERVEGQRLSAILAYVASGRCNLSFDVATALVRQLVAAVSRLHAFGRDIAHGALAPERVVVGAQGGLVIVEPVLGPAIELLQWSRRRLWRSLRVAMPQAAGLSRFDQRADIAQAGAIALAVLLGRPLRDEEFPDGLNLTLREASDRVARANPTLALGFAGWLLKAMQIEGRSFGSAKEALVALDDLLAAAAKPVSPAPAESAARRPAVHPLADGHSTPAPAARRSRPATPIAREAPARAAAASRPEPAAPVRPLRINLMEGMREGLRTSSMYAARTAIAVVAIATAAAGTARYCYDAAASAETRVRTVAAAEVTPYIARVRVKPPVTVPAPAEPEIVADALILPGEPVAGWIAISAPVDVTIYEGGKRLAEVREGRLRAVPGAHEIEIVNETLGFREKRRVDVRPARSSIVTVHLPFSAVDLNATPWAEVWVDGARIGETPVGSLSLPIGPHEFVFRHPEFGERRYALSLTAAGPVRLSVDMTRQ